MNGLRAICHGQLFRSAVAAAVAACGAGYAAAATTTTITIFVGDFLVR